MNEVLRQLAEAAGLLPHWQNFEGEEQIVDKEVVCAMLAAMQLDASSDAACRASLAELQREREETLPALLVAEVGESLRLPAALGLGGGEQLTLTAETGDSAPLMQTVRAQGDHYECDLPTGPGYYQLQLGDFAVRVAVAPHRCCSVPDVTGKAKAWGLAAQLYALRAAKDGGLGTFGALAELAQLAAARGADALAISPVHALFAADVHHHSPYSPSSRLFLNPLYVDLTTALPELGIALTEIDRTLLQEAQALEAAPLVNWPRVATLRWRLLRLAWQQSGAALCQGTTPLAREFQRFRKAGGRALEDHARFEALHGHHYGQDAGKWHWQSWGERYATPEAPGVATFAAEHADEVTFHIFAQWLADRDMAAAQDAAERAGMGIGLIADLAVGTDSGGSHAWSFQRDMLIGAAVGAPPDLLNKHGQNWGLTTFSPRALQQHGFQPFIDLLRASLRHARGLRIDHVLGLRRLWVIPDGFDDGIYLQYPLPELLRLVALESWRHQAVICGEDLGTVPPGLREALMAEGILGMRVLWFEREHGLFIEPARWSDAAMAVTTTHDLPTVAGWWRGRDIDWRVQAGHVGATDSEPLREERAADRIALWNAFAYANVGTAASAAPPAPEMTAPVVDAAIEFVGRTAAPLTIVPLEDIAGLEEQPNLPGTTDQHPNWRRRLPAPTAELLQQPACERRLELLQRVRTQP
ncbi:MAG: 4-alpha-glucanotransferase [Spongiibacteraceae bacterium]|jgi:4-alpha-glucanotransferase|nr:4-alpha-glucanotransferase [Spongiibacteraceae bacterium]